MNKEALKEKLLKEGFVNVYEWHDEPGVEYRSHSHKGAVAFYILEGSVSFRFRDKEVELKSGNRIDVPVGEEHSARVGSDGCTFLVGEMIEGDS